MTYFDHAASTPLSPKALKILSEASAKAYANPAANHDLGKDLSHRLDQCRQLILQTLNADSEIYQVVFTGSATEANNMVIQTYAKKNLVIKAASGDHPSVVKPVASAKNSIFFKNNEFNPQEEQGLVDLLVVTHINSQSGLVFPLKEVTSLSSKAAKAIHVDAAQSFCKLPIDLSDGIIDSMAISAHKMGGPKGVSALILKKDAMVEPLMLGGDHEFGLRPSTVALPLVLAWAASIQEREVDMMLRLERTQSLAQTLARELSKDTGHFLFPLSAQDCSPYINCIVTRNIPSDMMVRHLQKEGLVLSSSTACSSKSGGSSQVFDALGIEKKFHKSVLRVSFGAETTEADVLRLAQTLRATYSELKKWAD